ncbi:MAG: hypothetical protein AAGG07_09230 [Planctomycetota bacterium]
MIKLTLIRLGVTGVLLGIGSLAATMGYRSARSDLTAEIYRGRLEVLATEFGRLRIQYNEAVARQAVTELIVRDGTLAVRVRTPGGVVEQIPTRFDPAGEIYVDYVVLDGRLWIRRLFDELTPPASGLVIDPELAGVDWNDPGAAWGQAVYRSLDEGRWVVTVTGTGSLGLRRVGPADEQGLADEDLQDRPEVKDFEAEAERAEEQIREIGPGEVWRRLIGG